VQAVLTSRIDRLPPDEKDLLQTLAVIGTEFPVTLAAAVTGKSQPDLARALTNLQLAEFIYERPGLSDVEYKFKHALTHDVAYNSVLIERRKLVHERAGAAMETLYAGRLDDHLGAIANHYSQSQDARKAIHYLRLAGVQAAQRSANRESVLYFKNALDIVRSLPETLERKREELDLLVTLGPVLMTVVGMGAAEPGQIYVRARELCGELGDNTRLFPVVYGLWQNTASHVELAKARELADELMSLAEGLGDEALRIEAHHAMWTTLWLRGELTAARVHTESSAALYNPRKHGSLASLYGGHDPGVCGRNHGAVMHWLLGYPARALESSRQALALAHELAHPNSLAWALVAAAIVDQLRAERAETAAHADAAIALSAEHGFAQWIQPATVLGGWAKIDPATQAREVANMRKAIAAWQAAHQQSWVPYYLAITAERCSELERLDEALELITEALDLIGHTGERWYEAELHRLSGELSLLRDPASVSAAERSLRTAIEVARKQEAKSLELRATTSLTRLLRDTGRGDEARAMLSDIYNWFTEGFDTADLKDAKALLDEISG